MKTLRESAVGLLLLGTAVLPSAAAQAPADQDRDFAVRCGTLHVGDGRVLNDVWLIVQDGDVARIVEGDAAPAGMRVVDASDKIVMPGIVAADSDLSGHPDAEYNVTPDCVALDGFDLFREHRVPLSGGVTTVYLSPGRNRLVPGQGSVVKLAGLDVVERVLAETACLRITLGAAASQAPAVFEPTVYPTSDDPLLPARRQYPSSRLSQLATLRALFQEAAATPENGLEGPGSAEDRFDPAPLRQVLAGELGVRVAAREAADIRRAVVLAEELGARLVLEDPWEIAPAAAIAAAHGARAVFRVPVRLSAANPGGEDRRQLDAPRPTPAAPAHAAAAGIPVALAPATSAELDDFLMVAGIAVRHGLPRDTALRAITSTAAEILGVEDRVGSLQPGKDADFLVLSGDPFAIGTMVEQTWIDGTKVYEREVEAGILAIRAARILTGEGETIDAGVVIVADGKIKGIGADLAIPYGAEIVDLGAEGVMVPGFIDGNSSLGLSGDGTGVPGGSPEQRVADVIDPRDPTFAAARAAGVTTVLVSGEDQGLVSGRVAAIKTGAADRESMVVDELAGLRFVFDELGEKAIEPLEQQIERGRRYLEAWQKYEQALADWKAGKGEKPEPADAPPPDATPPDPVTGTWQLEMEIMPGAPPAEITAELKLEGQNVTGTLTFRFGEQSRTEDLEGATFDGRVLKAEITMMSQTARIEATLENDRFEGTVAAMGREIPITGSRLSAEAAAAAAPVQDDGEPKKPNVDESLEPIRALLEKRATAIVRTDRAPAIRAVVELFEKAGIRYALHGAEDAVETPALLGEKPPPVLLGPEVVQRDGMEVINAAARIADAGADVAIVTGDTLGTRYLPLHVAHAIRWGMDPTAALRAMTIVPARTFGIDDRVGSLERGKDADLVVFDGSPFDLGSRVLLVVCNGRIVHDAREVAR